MNIDNFFCLTSGTCPVCAGQSDGDCYCEPVTTSESAHSSKDISIQLSTVLIPNHSRQLKKDNISHKRVSKIIKHIYRQIVGEKIDEEYRKYYHRQDFFVIILNLLEREAKISDVSQIFNQKLKLFEEDIQVELKNQIQYLSQIKRLIKAYKGAYLSFVSGNYVECMKQVYDYENMRQKKNYNEAIQFCRNQRRTLGLSIQNDS